MTAPLSVHDFITAFRAFQHTHETTSRDAVVGFVNRFKTALPGLQESERRLRLETAPNFNVFTALGIERKEELFHTPILAHLLDPLAEHGQGFLFLRAFFKVCGQKEGFIVPIEPLEQFRWIVRPEVFIGDSGEIDQVIECPQQRFIVILENKIDAGEQPRQLRRYYDWMLSHRTDYTHKQMVFLTPEGRHPKTADGAPYIRLSYRKDIRLLLNETLGHVKPQSVRNCINQYLTVVKQITGDRDNAEPTRQEHASISDTK